MSFPKVCVSPATSIDDWANVWRTLCNDWLELTAIFILHLVQTEFVKRMIDKNIRRLILERLHETEKNEGVRILMAIESGSRAWGFASPDSDYDVRFIYARDKDWYMSVDLEQKRDVIEYPIVNDIDLNGWDVRKALKLFSKSNPAFVEWIQSPVTYMESGSFRQDALALLPEIYSVEKGIYHYRSMAKTNYRGYLRSEFVPLKKYFYVLRPLLSIRWLEINKNAAPIEFDRVLALVKDSKLLEAIEQLLQRKKSGQETAKAPAIPVLNRFIESELDRLEGFNSATRLNRSNMDTLNHLFRKVLEEINV